MRSKPAMGWVSLAWLALAAVPATRAWALAYPRGAAYVSDGAICIVGYNDMREMLEALDARFSAEYPEFRFHLLLPSTRSAPPALAWGVSGLAPMGAEFSDDQRSRYRDVTGAEPLAFRIAHASLSPRARSSPLAIFVNRDNPLDRLDLAQLQRIFAGGIQGGGQGGGVQPATATWGALGLSGPWVDRPIDPVGLEADTALGSFMRERALDGRTFVPGFRGYAQSTQVIAAIGADPAAIGFADLSLATPQVKVIALAQTPGGPASRGSAEDLLAGRYPLDRSLYLYVRQSAGQPLEPWVRAYLRLALSDSGQQAIASGTLGYLPLSAGERRTELQRLDALPSAAGPAGAAVAATATATATAEPIRCSGGVTMRGLTLQWLQGFRRSHPQIAGTLDTSAKLSADGTAQLLAGRVNCVLMVRELFPAETAAYSARFGHPPALIPVAGGSFETRGGTHAIAIYVNAANPLRNIGLDQLRSVFGRAAGGAASYSQWGQLGLTGEWRDRPLHVYGMLPRRSTGNPPGVVNYLQRAMLDAGEFRDDLRVQTDAPGTGALQAIVERVAEDPDGIGFSGFGYALPGTRILAVGRSRSGPFITGSAASVADRSYPLSRLIYIAVDPEALAAPHSSLYAFLSYVLGAGGQQQIGADAEGFLPLTAAELRAARRQLAGLTRWSCQ